MKKTKERKRQFFFMVGVKWTILKHLLVYCMYVRVSDQTQAVIHTLRKSAHVACPMRACWLNIYLLSTAHEPPCHMQQYISPRAIDNATGMLFFLLSLTPPSFPLSLSLPLSLSSCLPYLLTAPIPSSHPFPFCLPSLPLSPVTQLGWCVSASS